jgi:hypothetical protein
MTVATITKEQNRQLHMLLNELNLAEQKAALVYSYSNNRTGSSKELMFGEARELIRHLQEKNKKNQPDLKPMRGKIIHYLCLLGYTLANGKADFDRINEFIKGIGSNNPRKVILNYLRYDELYKVVNQVEQMYRNETNRAAKKYESNTK